MLSLDPNAVNQKYPGNDLVEEYFCSGAIVTWSEDNKNVITRAINAMFWWDTHLDLLLDFFFTLIEILHNQT